MIDERIAILIAAWGLGKLQPQGLRGSQAETVTSYQRDDDCPRWGAPQRTTNVKQDVNCYNEYV